MTQETVIKILKKNLPYLREVFYVKRVALFGSIAKNTYKKGSDVDILVEFTKPIGLKFMDLAEYLEKAIGRKTDILTSEGIKGIRIKNVARDIMGNLRYV